ncbi:MULTISPECIES: PLP-dependent aminotransferase family protein [Rhodomicrobium]|uniref:aminotransferase-like domain-containing protein n=1 Tax=Rhodomicrobium TaxID=1068 RepID=UPI000B4A90FD|nr:MULTISPECIES: PLP-dependent aminotransferase family protein [Rhodomicrobium]
MSLNGADAPYRYEALAEIVSGLLDSGVLRAGMRAPSIRRIAADHSLSISTVLHAYRLLEDRGILEARPKSGFYVVAGGAKSRDTPKPSKPRRAPTDVTVSRGVLSLLDYAARPDIVPLGCAIPSADLLAAGGLDRFLARAARVKGRAYNIYTEPRGDPQLRAEICRRALRSGHALGVDGVAITNGCTEALSLALRAVTKRGDSVAIESPTYFGLLQVLEALELKAVELPTDAGTGLDIGALARLLAAKPVKACLLSSSFNNPLGCSMSDDGKRAVLALLQRHGVPLIEDDIYGDIYFGAERPKPFSALAPGADIIYCSSFSKTLAPGYRIGWIAPQRHMQRVLEAKFAMNICSAALPQAALAEFLASGGYDGHLRRLRRSFAENIDRISRAVDKSFPAETRVTRPAGGFVLWLEMPDGFDSRRLFDLAIARGICFAPGDVFSASKSHAHCLRLSCGHPWDARIEDSIHTLGALTAGLLGA